MSSLDDVTSAPAERLRKIVHVDMDAFYASVEQRDDHIQPVLFTHHQRVVDLAEAELGSAVDVISLQ